MVVVVAVVVAAVVVVAVVVVVVLLLLLLLLLLRHLGLLSNIVKYYAQVAFVSLLLPSVRLDGPFWPVDIREL